MSEWKFIYIYNECSHYSLSASNALAEGNNPMVGAPKDKECPTCWAIAVDIAGALSK